MPFGNSRRLPSRRWQARYTHSKRQHKASNTFRTKAHATAWLVAEQTHIDTRTWTAPECLNPQSSGTKPRPVH